MYARIGRTCLLPAILFFVGYSFAQSPVPVRKEPRHKVVLENEYVRLIEVHLKPHDTTLAHIHAAPSVIVFLSRSTIGSQILGAPPTRGSHLLPGQIGYAAYDENPITHRVWNEGDSTFHVMDIELVKTKAASDSCDILLGSGVQMPVTKSLVRVYRLDLAVGNEPAFAQSTCAHLVIDIEGVVLAGDKRLSRGNFSFFGPQEKVAIKSLGKSATCVVLELK
ncbi:MAG TPA: hypothetical protein VKR32_16640 [Puia sp.]|nr:hypothetical protein [Puia sp.]